LKVSRQCPLVLLVEVGRREGKALGSEEVKTLRYRVMSRSCTAHEQNSDINVGKATLGRNFDYTFKGETLMITMERMHCNVHRVE
jgi:hypothetical protein